MAIKNSLLKEAIADAKAVKDIAVENAKIALQEAFTPRIQSMLSAKIQNEIEGGDEEVPEEAPAEEIPAEEEVPISDEVPAEETPAEEPVEEPVEEPTEEPTEEPVEEPEEVEEDLELEALIRELESDTIEEGIADESGIGTADNKKPAANASDSSDIGKKKEAPVGDKAKETKDFLAEEGDPFDGESFGDESDVEDVEGDGYGSDDGGVDIDEIISQLEEGDTKMSDEPESCDEDVNIDEIIAELEAPAENTTDTEKITDVSINSWKKDGSQSLNEVKKLQKEVKTLKSELKEYVEAVKFMKDKLNEVNLLNAKLLYTNKLFKSFALTNEQKMMVVESFDRATNARETKLTYVTLAETLNKTGKSVVAKVVNESVSKPVTSTKPAETVQKSEILNESADIAKRFKQLSGLDKNMMPNYR